MMTGFSIPSTGRSSAAERFEYDYSDGELGELAPQMLQLSKAVRHLHVVLNNCFEDRGQRNARRLMDFLHVRSPGAADEQLQFD